MKVGARADWGAPHQHYPQVSTPVSRLFLHHSVTPAWTGAKAPQRLEEIARGRGFNGISYSYVATVAGEAWEGRALGQGAHTAGYNSTSLAICLVGNFDRDHPPEAMVEGVAQLVAHGHQHGWWPDHITDPHRAVSQTACPGRYAVEAIPRINARAAQILRGDTEPEEDPLSGIDEKNREWLNAFANDMRRDGIGPNTPSFISRAFQAARRQLHEHREDFDPADPDQVGVAWADRANAGDRVRSEAEKKGFGLAEFVGKAADLVRRGE